MEYTLNRENLISWAESLIPLENQCLTLQEDKYNVYRPYHDVI